MKTVRLILGSAAAILVVALLGFMVGLNSGFQTWAAHRYLARHPELQLQIGRVSARFHHVRLTDVQWVRNGLRLEAPTIDADVGVVATIFADQIDVSQLKASGWTVAIDSEVGRAVPGAPSSNQKRKSDDGGRLGETPRPTLASTKGFHGVFSPLDLPADLSIDDVQLEGVVRFSTGDVKVTIKGGGAAAGRPAAAASGRLSQSCASSSSRAR